MNQTFHRSTKTITNNLLKQVDNKKTVNLQCQCYKNIFLPFLIKTRKLDIIKISFCLFFIKSRQLDTVSSFRVLIKKGKRIFYSWLVLSRNEKNNSKTIPQMKSRNCEVMGD